MKILDKSRYDEVYKILEDNFPPDERRTYEQQKDLLNSENYRIYTVEKDDVIIAFFAVWVLDGIVFGEHLAVDKKYHNGGIGSRLLIEVVKLFDVPFVLEIELENSSEMAKRRGGFYRRLGFNINNYEYAQPSYGVGKSAIPMHLVSYPDGLNETEFEKYKNIIYKEIYKIKGI